MQRTVLLLDDDAQFRASVTPALEALGMRVLTATKGSIARTLVEDDEPSLLVVDGLLPDTNGIAWIEELRRDGFDTPIVFVSAFYRDLPTFRHLTQVLDVKKVYHKPVTVDRFARALASVVASQPPRARVPSPVPKDSGDDSVEEVVYPEQAAEASADPDEARESYVSRLPVVADKLTGAVRRVHSEATRTSLVSEALRQAHALHGSASQHGFSDVSDAAARIEGELRQLQESGRLDWSAMFESIDSVRAHAAAAAGRSDDSGSMAAAPPSVTPAASFFLHRPIPKDVVPTLIVLEDDPAMIAYLRSALDLSLIHITEPTRLQ